jgi:nucleotide-binding universal stress UspA family protein
MPAKPIVVGTDGSAQSRHAVEWAARQAALCDVPLLIVSVISVSQRTGRSTLVGDRTGVTRAMAQEALQEAARSARLAAGTLLLAGVPALALARQARGASMLVVGGRGAGSTAAAGAGSVSRYLAAHAPCPVVICFSQAARGRSQIAVGIGEHDESEAAIGFAFEEASRRGADLLAVRSVYGPGPARARGLAAGPAGAPASALCRLRELLDPWRRKYPDVAAREQIAPAGLHQALADITATASLLVLGRDPGPGSASRAVLDHARGPVAIVPHRETPA